MKKLPRGRMNASSYEHRARQRLKARVTINENGCWIIDGFALHGYGRFGLYGKVMRAHRAAWILFRGPIPEGLTIDHQCHTRDCPHSDGDCPHRRCVNPDHLKPCPIKENTLRGHTVNASNAAKTHCKRGHPLEGENLYVYPSGRRQCRICGDASKRAHYLRTKGAPM